MDPVEFTISFDTTIVGHEIAQTLLDVLYEYVAVGGFSDDINPELNQLFNIYLIGTGSGLNEYTFTVSKGWLNPGTKEISLSGRKK